jgi:hypothetical protein
MCWTASWLCMPMADTQQLYGWVCYHHLPCLLLLTALPGPSPCPPPAPPPPPTHPPTHPHTPHTPHTSSQIRAANLSGDCSFWQEALRGNLGRGLVGQHVRCVERRALLSVGLNPHCQGGKAEAAVAEMLPRCLKDTDPWPSVPGLK